MDEDYAKNFILTQEELIYYFLKVPCRQVPANLFSIVNAVYENYHHFEFATCYLSELLDFNIQKLNYYTNKYLGMTIKQFIDLVRMLHVLKMFFCEERIIFDVAIEVGFHHQKTFRTVVHRHFNMCPRELKTQINSLSNKEYSYWEYMSILKKNVKLMSNYEEVKKVI